MAETNKNICNFCVNYNCTRKNEMYREKCDFYTPITELGFAIVTMDQWRKYQQFKSDYENRLKADMVTMLEEFDLSLSEYEDADLIRVEYIRQDIQEKINALKGEEE